MAYSHIEGLSDTEFLDELKSKLVQYNMNADDYLGGIGKDSNGKIINATAIKVTFINAVSDTNTVDKHADWENAYVKYIQREVSYDILCYTITYLIY